jgi:UDP-3-O-[3-hydroxymyristoyl] N-acetylglucosamine deacetylase
MQATIRSDVSFSGVGLHSGRLTRMTIRPHAANMGLWFRRADLPGKPYVPARYDRVAQSRLCTQLDGATAGRPCPPSNMSWPRWPVAAFTTP